MPVDGEKVTRRLGHPLLLVATGQAYRTQFSNLGFLFDFRFANSNPSSDHWTLALFTRVSREVEVLSSHAAKCKCLRSLGPRDEDPIARTCSVTADTGENRQCSGANAKEAEKVRASKKLVLSSGRHQKPVMLCWAVLSRVRADARKGANSEALIPRPRRGRPPF